MPSLEALRAQTQAQAANLEKRVKLFPAHSRVRVVLASSKPEHAENMLGSSSLHSRLFLVGNQLLDHRELLYAANSRNQEITNEERQEAREAVSAGIIVYAQMFVERGGVDFNGSPMTSGLLFKANQLVGNAFEDVAIDEFADDLMMVIEKRNTLREIIDFRSLLVAATNNSTIPTKYNNSAWGESSNGLVVFSEFVLYPALQQRVLLEHLAGSVTAYKQAEQDVLYGLRPQEEATRLKIKAFQEITIALLKNGKYADRRQQIYQAYQELVQQELGQTNFPEAYGLLTNEDQFTPLAEQLVEGMPFGIVTVDERRRESDVAYRAAVREQLGFRRSGHAEVLPFPAPKNE